MTHEEHLEMRIAYLEQSNLEIKALLDQFKTHIHQFRIFVLRHGELSEEAESSTGIAQEQDGGFIE